VARNTDWGFGISACGAQHGLEASGSARKTLGNADAGFRAQAIECDADPPRPRTCSGLGLPAAPCLRVRLNMPAEDVRQSDPSSPQFVAYYASTLDRGGRDGGAPWHKDEVVEQRCKTYERRRKTLIARLPSGAQYDAREMQGFPISRKTRRATVATYIPFPAAFGSMSVEHQQN
jgi:hypothetical protein